MEKIIRLQKHTLHIPGLNKQYRFLHITDAHLLLYDANKQGDTRSNYYASRVRDFMYEGKTTTEYFDALWAYALEHQHENDPEKLDGILLTGDIIDFPSPENLCFLREKLSQLSIPYVYVTGNHDWSYFDDYHTPHSMIADRPLLAGISGGNFHIHKEKIGELTFVAVDDSLDMYEDGVAETLEAILKDEKNVLLMQHVPFFIPSLHDDTVKRWKSDLNIGGGDVDKNENWKKVKAIILAEDTPVKAMITGHLHFDHEDWLEGKIPQYVTALAAFGHAAIFEFQK